jgi:peptide/nickel transport system substrate-binding protein
VKEDIMSGKGLSRRDFLKVSAVMAVGITAASCAQPTPQVIEKEVPVEKIVKETVIVEKEVPVEKVVKETVIVEREVPVEKVRVVEGEQPSKYHEPPMLADRVARGELPPVAERLPEDPLVLDVVHEIGQYGGTLRRGYTGMADKWNAAKMEEGMLMRWRQPEGGSISLVPYVCSKFESNADASEFTWYLRRGIKWSDGVTLTTEDVRWWYEDLVQEGVIPLDIIWQPGGEDMVIEIVDDYTFKTVFAAPNPITPTWLASTEGLTSGRGPNFADPAHYMKQFHAKYADKEELDKKVKEAGLSDWKEFLGAWSPATSMFTNPDRPVILAWKTKEPPPAARYVMERNPYFWQVDPAGNQLPYIDEIAMDLFESREVFNFKLLNGEIDCQGRHVSSANFTLLQEGAEKGDYRVESWVNPGGIGYGVNTAYGINEDPVMHELLNDVRFRQALSVAINREEIVDLAYDGLMTPRQASAAPGTLAYDPEWETLYAQYDPDLANELLDELGLDQRDSEGFRLRADGETVSLLLEGIEGIAMTGTMDQHQLVKENWEAVGVKTIVRAVSRELQNEHNLANQLPLNVWGGGYAITYGMHGPAVNPPGRPYAEWYLSGGEKGIEPPEDHPWWEIPELWEQLKLEPDAGKREALWLKIKDVHKEQLWGIGVAGLGPALYIVKNNVRNFPTGLIDANTFRNLGLARPQQLFFT